MSSRRALIDNARTYVGSRFIHQGRIRTVQKNGRSFGGIDCAGMTIIPAQEVGIGLDVHVHVYAREPNGALMQEELAKWLKLKPLSDALPGDVVYLKHPLAKYAHHLGLLSDMYLGGQPHLGLIHACLRHRRVVECLFDKDFKLQTVACYSYPELVEDRAWPVSS